MPFAVSPFAERIREDSGTQMSASVVTFSRRVVHVLTGIGSSGDRGGGGAT